MKTSARNQYLGVVTQVTHGVVNADVTIDLGDGLQIVANITEESVASLDLKPGREALVLIKSSFVLLSADPAPRISARNRLAATVLAVTPGAVNAEVTLELAGKRRMIAIVTNEGLKTLGLESRSTCCAVIKASHVLVAVND